MLAGAQYDLDCTWSAFLVVRVDDELYTLTEITMLMPIGNVSPHDIVTLDGGFGFVNRVP